MRRQLNKGNTHQDTNRKDWEEDKINKDGCERQTDNNIHVLDPRWRTKSRQFLSKYKYLHDSIRYPRLKRIN